VLYAHKPGLSACRLPLAPPPPLQPPRSGLGAITLLGGPPIAAGSKQQVSSRLGGQRAAEGNRSAHVMLHLRARRAAPGRPRRGVFTKRWHDLARKAMLNRRILMRTLNTYPERSLAGSLRSGS
jgi:hypothetical protein